ncbi:MAG: hypothetical protein LBT04_07290 [Prevotellaceae bacterium]|jgi:hypothetical protein|nr:hypothetical protein [Prevotellaceae bacterium]
MKNIVNVSVMAICLAFVSCQNGNNLNDKAGDSQFANKVTQRMLFNGSSKYALILSDNAMLGYYSIKQNSLADEFLDFYNSTLANSQQSNGQALAPAKNQLDFSINGVKSSELQAINNVNQSNLFGQDVSFNFATFNGIPTAIAQESGNETTMYVPKIVHITNPNIEKSEDLLPYCYYKDFILGWNADSKNTNGLIVLVEWTGNDMFGKNYKQVVRNADIIEHDDGKALLNNALFDDIPQGALVKLMLIRGNVTQIENYIEKNGETEMINLFAASQAILPFILVREIGN